MIPQALFHDLVDDRTGFTVIRTSLNGPAYQYKVTAPSQGQISLSIGNEKIRDNANQILGRLNWLLAQDDWEKHSLEQQFDPSLDPGSPSSFTIIPNLGRKGRENRPERYEIKTMVLYSDTWAHPTKCVVQVGYGGRNALYACALGEGILYEMDRLSRHAMPRYWHAKIAAGGIGWDDAPDAVGSFVELYGENALVQAELERDLEEVRMSSAMMAAKEKLGR